MGAAESDIVAAAPPPPPDARLAPWHSVLRELASPLYVDDRDRCLLETDECLLWLPVIERYAIVRQGRASVPMDLGRTREALLLLELLARVDFDAWVREMFMIWPESTRRGWVEFTLKPAALKRPLRLGLMVPVSSASHIDSLICLCGTMPPSQEYLETRERLLDIGDRRSRGQEDKQFVPVPVCVEHEIMHPRSTEVTEMLQSMLQTVQVLQRASQNRPDQGTELSYTIYEVRSATESSGVVTKASLKLLVELRKLGIRMGNLPLLALSSPQPGVQEPTAELFEAIRTLTAQGVDDPDQIQTGVWSVIVSHKQSQPATLSVLSAVTESKCVRDVEIDLNEDSELEDDDEDNDDVAEDDFAEEWEWVAYHLFSRFANHNIHFLNLNLNKLKPIEVDGVRDVLAAKNPLAILDGRVADSDSDGPQELVATRFCVTYPKVWGAKPADQEERSTISEEYFLTTPEPVTVRGISRPSGEHDPWWLVVLGGVGIAWLHKDDILSFVDPASQDQLIDRPSFPAVIITDISDESKDSSVDLLELISHGTRRLELQEPSEINDTYDDWCESVLRVCPQLDELFVAGAPLLNLEVFVAAAEEGHSRLRKLKLHCVQTDETKYACAFFAALSDPLHPLMTHLEQLDLSFVIDQANFTVIIDAARRMLKQNRRLHHIRLGFQLVVDQLDRSEEIKQAFESELATDVSVRVAPLDLDCKTAFLSVIDANASESTTWGQFDSGVIANVFQFAAVSRDRLFQVACFSNGF